MDKKQLGIITQGSLQGGLEMRLSAQYSVEDVRVGKFVAVEGQQSRFFSMITNVTLGTSNPKILLDPPEENSFLAEVLKGSAIFGTVSLQPMLMLERGATEEELRPVKTIPSHFSPVYEADEADFTVVFGSENDPHSKRFYVGQPLDMETHVCIDLDRFVERSNGIFGKSGTGKSFLARLALCGVIYKKACVNLIFDMHNEYGWQALCEGKTTSTVKGLKQLFNDEIVVFTLDSESSKRRGIRDAQELFISYDQIEVEDIALLKEELNLSEASIESALILKEAFGEKRWFRHLLDMSGDEIDEFVRTDKGHGGAIKALQRKLIKITELKYLKAAIPVDAVSNIVRYLSNGKNVILEFGGQNNLLSYMLAANLITRRIHREWVKTADAYNADPLNVQPPPKVMITIEEAHKFLAPSIAKSTIFGTIAREMRKYFVTLLIIDQRPSGIDNEILSQVGTRITALLNDDKDIDAVFTGVSGGANLKTILSQLDPKQQILVLGYAVPMPVVLKTRNYDSEFYKAVSNSPDLFSTQEILERGEQLIVELFDA